MKKLSLFLALLLIFLSASTAWASEIDPSKLDPYEIVWYTVGSEESNDAHVMEKINEYLTEKFNCTLKLVRGTYKETVEKIKLLVSASEPFDLALVTADYSNFVAMQALYPLNDLLQKRGSAIMEKWPAALWQAVNMSGEVYAIPTHKFSCSHLYFAVSIDQANAVNVDTSWIHDDKLDKTAKWKAFMQYCKDMKAANAGTNGYVTSLSNSVFQALYPYEGLTGNSMDPIACIIGDDSFANKEHNKVFNIYDTPEFAQFCRDAYELSKAGCLPLDPDTGAKLANNDPACPIQDSMAKRLSGYEKTYAQDLEAYFVNYAYQTTDKIYGSMNSISATSKDPERVMMFLNAICEDQEFANLVAYGIEGEDWNRNENGQIQKVKPNTWFLHTAYYPAFIVAEPDSSLPTNMVDLYNEFAKTLVPSDNLGFSFDETPVMTELSAVRQVTAEYVKPLCSGLSDPDVYLPEFLEALKNAGVDAIQEELQRQVDAFRASAK